MISRCRDSRVAVGRLPPPPRLNYPPEAHHHWLQVTKCACTSVLFVSTGHGSGGGGRGSYHVHRAESSVLTTDQSTPALTIITRADTWDRHMRHMSQHWSITSTHHHQHQQISLTLAHLAALLCSVHYLRKHSQINCIFKEMNTCLVVVGVRID